MLKYFACGIAVVLLGTILGCATEQSQSRPQSASDKNSGFLRDYTKLHEARDPEGLMVRQWVSPKFTRDNYNAILLDPLVFYPEPRPTDKVSAETLQQMLSYSDNVLKRSLSKRFKLVDRVGPRVARLRIGITGVDCPRGRYEGQDGPAGRATGSVRRNRKRGDRQRYRRAASGTGQGWLRAKTQENWRKRRDYA